MAKRSQKPILDPELKASAHSMVGYGFWKHLERFMTDLEKESIEKQDSVELSAAMAGHFFCESRAVRATIKRIKEEVEQYTQ